MKGRDMARFWDARARENAAYFVDNRLGYTRTDLAAFWAGGSATVDEVLGQLGNPKIESSHDVIEIGCGLGRLTRTLAQRAGTVRALDVSPQMIHRAREANAHLDNVDWIVGDGVSLTGIPDRSADVVFSHVVFQHIPDPGITLGYVREMGRVLRAGGWAAFQISNDPAVHRPRRESLLWRLGRALRIRPGGQGDAAWLGSAVDLDDLRRAASEGGLRVDGIHGAGTQFCFVLLRRDVP